jgi:hypothetical protein
MFQIDKENLEILINIISVATAFLSMIIGKPLELIMNSQRNRKFRKILNTKEIDFFLDKFDDDFKKTFILPDLKGNFFYIQTGIYTNEVSIDKYIELKNRLGKNFTWENIKDATSYLKFEDDKLTIKVPKFVRIAGNILTIFAISFIVFSFLLFIYYSSDYKYFTKTGYIKLSVMTIFPIVCSIFLLYSINPIITATSIAKRLEEYDAMSE